jgi:serine/threonine-protein kinase
MGSVWAAHHETLDRNFAVKFMAPELAAIPESRARFKREAESAMRLRSPHVVQIVEHTTLADGLPYIAMELLSGEDLHQRLSRCGPLTIEETLAVVTQAARALEEAHALGIVHRDIKPENLFLTPRAEGMLVKVLDFGVAAEVATSALRLTNTGVTLGTPIYMSPEQFVSARTVDPRSDLWSLAVVAYLCLTGRAPFGGDTFGAVCVSVERRMVTPPSALRAGLPRAVDEWFARAFSRRIEDRFQSAGEMAAALAMASGPSVDASAKEAPAQAPGKIDASESPTWPFAPSVVQAPALSAVVVKPSPRRLWAAPLFAVAVMLVVSTLGPRAHSADSRPSGRHATVVSLTAETARTGPPGAAVAPSMDAGVQAR